MPVACDQARSRRPADHGRQDCGLEVRGGGNATRQIIDILPPAAEADRLLVCEVLTPAGNWSSYPPHKHDRHAAAGRSGSRRDLLLPVQRRATATGSSGSTPSDGRTDQTIQVTGPRPGHRPRRLSPVRRRARLPRLLPEHARRQLSLDGGDRRPALRAPAGELAAAGSARADDRPARLTAMDLQGRYP